MKYSTLSTSQTVSKLCFGCEPLGGTDWGNVNIDNIEAAINRAIELGVNFFDTADVYGLGLSEERLSSILGHRIHDMTIATKGGVSWVTSRDKERVRTSVNCSVPYIQKAVEDSLRRLNLDCLPLYYIHYPDPNTEIRHTFECLSKLQSQGKIKLLGCSNYNSDQLSQACEVARISVLQIPVNFLLGAPTQALLDTCIKFDIKIVAYNVLSYGLLTGKYNSTSRFKKNDRRSLLPLFQPEQLEKALKVVNKAKILAQNEALSVGQYAINWVLQQENIAAAITGIKNVEQVEQNLSNVL